MPPARVKMKSRDFDYPLPPELIAQAPAPERDASRLLIVRREGGPPEHRTFRELTHFLRTGDLLVLNDTRVNPARLILSRSTGGRVEALLLRRIGSGRWESLLDSGGKPQIGETLRLEDGSAARLENRNGPVWTIEFAAGDEIIDRLGRAPLPPYIKRATGPNRTDLERYQTVYADKPGSVAA